MKTKLLLTFFACFFCWIVNGQNVIIPDVNFKASLVGNTSINTNADGEIQVSEAVAFTGTIIVNALGISDLTGIQAFTALTGLSCSYNNLTSLNVSVNSSLTHLDCNTNQLTTLNVSANTSLTYLNCSYNPLISLNVSGATALTDLFCGVGSLTNLNISSNTALTVLSFQSSQLTTLNISTNTALTYLNCQNNKLTALNVSTNTALTQLWAIGNQLTSLDVSFNTALTHLQCVNNQLANLNLKNGYNTNFVYFNATNNPSLTCIQVDNVVYSNTNWLSCKDSTATYSQNCSITGIVNLSNENEITFYPNPFSEIFTIKLDKPTDANISVYDLLGNCVYTSSIKDPTETTIDLSKEASGIYFVKVTNVDDSNVKKIIKE